MELLGNVNYFMLDMFRCGLVDLQEVLYLYVFAFHSIEFLIKIKVHALRKNSRFGLKYNSRQRRHLVNWGNKPKKGYWKFARDEEVETSWLRMML